MNADINRLMDNLRVRLPGATDTALKLEFFTTMDLFFQNTNIWVEDVEFAVTPDVKDYVVTPSGVATIVRLMGVVNADEKPVGALMMIPGELELVISPTQSSTYTARIALTVTDPTTRDDYPEFPDWIITKYGANILNGVLGRMMSQIAKPYSNERMAIYHMREFSNCVAIAKVEAQHRNVYRGQSWRFPQTFARRRARAW
jgi:hypothetical protein